MNKEKRILLSQAATFQDQDAVHEIFSELRREDPVAWCPELEDGLGFWSVTKYDDIQFVSKNPKKHDFYLHIPNILFYDQMILFSQCILL